MSTLQEEDAVGHEAQSAGQPRRWIDAAQALIGDRQLSAVLLVWFLCSLALLLYVNAFSVSLPYCDEWALTPVATGHEPLTWRDLWRPTNEHRMPLNRLAVVVLGRIGKWDMRLIHLSNLALLSLGALALVLAARAVRGESAFSDVFLCLLVLTPGQYESTLYCAYSLVPALSVTCLCIGLLAVRWPMRSTFCLCLYLLGVLAVALSGGPAGNVWALGLCGALLPSLRSQSSTAWKRSAAGGVVFVGSLSLVMLALTPHVPRHDPYAADSLSFTLGAFAKVLVCWLGPALRVTWPWALLVLVVPGLLLVGHVAWDLRKRWRRPAGGECPETTWADLTVVLAAAMLLGWLIAYGRGKLDVWSPRYHTLLMPVGLLMYLLLVRFRAAVVPNALATVLAVGVGWSWPDALAMGRDHHAKLDTAVRELRLAKEPLTVLAVRHAAAVACLRGVSTAEGVFVDHRLAFTDEPATLLRYLVQLRNAHLSVFKHCRGAPVEEPLCWAHEWDAECGSVGSGMRVVDDPEALGARAVEVASANQPATLRYEVEVPRPGHYLLCSRVRTEPATPPVELTVNDCAHFDCSFVTGKQYHTSCLGPPLELSAGKHALTLTFTGPGARLDSLELMAWIP